VSVPERRLIGSSTVAFRVFGVNPRRTGTVSCCVLVRPQNSKLGDKPRSPNDTVNESVVVPLSVGALQEGGALITRNPTTPAKATSLPTYFRYTTGTVCILSVRCRNGAQIRVLTPITGGRGSCSGTAFAQD
jgi:hypothetical protein